jgi:Proto-chlorophyllide reductase 57 kD subunit
MSHVNNSSIIFTIEIRIAISVSNNISWTAEAEAKLKEIPFFVRPAARKKIEKFAQEQDLSEITVEIYDRAKQQFSR